ncbi:hypothetical protein FOL47_002072 [Perkinsus chesapeaki]|uniref:Endonuclease n=1 Tax=Perkinsus chesapeaki TaxID=330153 RepID=A0A7J6MFX8_PERCH|nr:hypothetical protein FOL47_002072 [Perkinsus chesapeaki]
MAPSSTTSITLRYIKLPNKDKYVPVHVLRSTESGHALFVIIEAQYATVSAQLLGDTVQYFHLANRPFLGAWIASSYKTQWRNSTDTIPLGKALPLTGGALSPEDVPVDIELPPAPEKFLKDPVDSNIKELTSFPAYSVRPSPASPTAPVVSEAAPVSTSGVYFEEPLFVVLPTHEAPVDGKTVPSETELVQTLYRWNSLLMGEKQSLSEYLKLFEDTRYQVERLQGARFDERVLKHKLLMTLPTVHREVGLAKMTSLGYLDLLHELIQLDRVRQLANAHRKTGHIPTNSKTINAVDNLAPTQSAPENRQQPRRGGKEGSKAVDEKTKSPTTTLTFENVLIAGTTTPVSTSPLRSTTVRVLSINGSVPITGLIDTGAEMTAISQNTMETLIREGVEVPQPKAYCTALMADGKPIRDCPIHDLVFIHGPNQISAPVVVIKDLSKDVLVSAHLFRQFTNPTIWLFSSVGDRLFNVGSLNPELKALWEAFYHRLTTSTLTPTDTSQIVDASIDDDTQSKPICLLNTSPDSAEEVTASFTHSSPVVYGITLKNISDRHNEEQLSGGLHAVSVVNADIDNLPDASTASTPINRYQHRIKWLKPKPANNVQALRNVAERLEQRLRRDGIFELYDAEIEKFKQKGYIKPVPSSYAKFCLNHFPVVRKHGNELSSMKVRPVFDGSSLRGIVSPNLTDCDKQHVTSSIYLLRRFAFCVSCDFQAAFLQVEYEVEEDCRYLCFWWRGVLYSYQRVLFGLPDSPSALIHALDDNLSTSREELRRVVSVDGVGNYGVRILMDDLSVGASCPALAQQVLSIVLKNASERGFEENEAKRVNYNNAEKSGSMLGYHWSCVDDTLTISAVRKSDNIPNLRRVDDYRRYIATFFDPCGFYLEHMMKARLHLQQAALSGKDAALTSKQQTVIQEWYSTLARARALQRQLYPKNDEYNTIVAYIDASNKASAIVVETVAGSRIWARGFVTPVDAKPTAPRMELDALCTASGLLKDFMVDIADYWGATRLIICTDSEVNLARLRKSPTAIKTPAELVKQRRLIKVRNNIHELQQKTGIQVVVTHIEGTLNPADPPSRGRLSDDSTVDFKLSYISQLRSLLDTVSIFDLGSLTSFYHVPHDYEPLPIPCKIDPKGDRVINSVDNLNINQHDGTERSSYEPDDIARILHQQQRRAQVFREWQRNTLDLGTPDHEQDPILSPLIAVVGEAQRRYGLDRLLQAPFTAIDENDYVVRKCRQDTNGMVHSQYVVPPREHALQRLIIKSIHGKSHHGVNATYNELVKNYHWPSMRRMVARMVTACGQCIKTRPRQLAAQGSLSKKIDRVPWSSVGIDHCGAYDNNGDKQKYLVVCTDLLTGFIDAEPTTSTNGVQLVTAVKRIFARRGTPRRICSDRGKAYLSGVFRLFTSSINIQHHLIPPGSPRYGGKWERSHGPLNENLKFLRSTKPRVDWRTVVAEAVSLSNARPRWSTISSWDLLHTYPQDQSKKCAPLPGGLLDEWIEGQWEDDRARTRERLGDKSKKVHIGDKVYLRTPSPHKLGELARGPYVVEEIKGHTYFLRELSTNRRLQQPLYKLITTI